MSTTFIPENCERCGYDGHNMFNCQPEQDQTDDMNADEYERHERNANIEQLKIVNERLIAEADRLVELSKAGRSTKGVVKTLEELGDEYIRLTAALGYS